MDEGESEGPSGLGLARTIHDLRSPLAVIVANADLILSGGRGEVTPGQRKGLQTILKAAAVLDERLLALREPTD